MGQVLQAGVGQAPARQAAVGAGIPKEVPADTINKVCASSIRAIEIADLMIRAGEHDVVVTGGMESMSNAPYLLPKARFGYRLGNGEVLDHMVFDGLTSTFDGLHMVAAGVAGVARARDLARGAGRVGVPLAPAGRRSAGRGPLRRRDRPGRRRRRRRGRPPRHDAREARGAAARLRPGGHDDGGQRARRQRRRVLRRRLLRGVRGAARPRAARHGSSRRATSPTTSRTSRATPARARPSRRSTKAGKTIDDVARVEINEAFASVAKNSTRMLGADEEIVNVNGGAVALGHPIGASGGRIVATLVHELRRNGGGLGLAAICSGGGQGDALLIEV